MSGDPLAIWRGNPFFVLEVSPRASRAEVERAGQKLIGLLALGSAGAGRYDTPFGPASRDADTVRQAVAALRDPVERVIHELWADVSRAPEPSENSRAAWTAAERAIGWSGKWAQ
jgi:hypothetical protein